MREGLHQILLAGMIVALGCGGSNSTPDDGGGPDASGTDGSVTDRPGTVEDTPSGTDLMPEAVADLPEQDAPAADLPDGSPQDTATHPDPGDQETPANDNSGMDLSPMDLPLDGPEDVSYLFPDCLSLQQCFQDCCKDQSPCPENCGTLCWDAASPEARGDWNAYLDCIGRQCPSCAQNPRPPDCDACERTAQAGACREETQRCWDFGEGSCAQVVACIVGCLDAEGCGACLGSASPEAHLWLDPLGQCLVTQCPSDPPDSPVLPLNACEIEALEGDCAPAYADCLAH